MEEKNSRFQRWRENLKHTYRLVVMNDETFEEVGSYKLNMLNFYVLISTVLVVVAILVYLLIAFTPLKRYIPGYGSQRSSRETAALMQEVNSLDSALTAWETYFEGHKNRVLEEFQTADEVAMPDPDSLNSEKTLPISDVDLQLREELELERVGDIMRRGGAEAPQISQARLEQLYFIAPVTGEISSPFMPDRNHLGVDVLAPKNTAIKATLDGYVFLSDWTLETGNTIGIQHGNNLISFYKHNSSLLKEAGSFVKAGEAIAIIGNTGTLSDGPHLHFELWFNGQPVNPVDYINF